jgi:uncharacterized protein YdaU (DUF1376 family)
VKIRRIDFSPGDWIGGTLGMSLEEEGLYIRLVARTYSLGESLDNDPTALAKLCQVRPQVMRRLLDRLKLMGKFHETGGKLVSNRCETEMKLAQNRLEQARFNGSKGGRPNGLAEPDGSRSVKPTSTITTNIIEEDSEASPLPPSDPVKEIFDRGLAILGPTHRSLLGKFRKSHGDEAVLDAILSCEAEGPSEPVGFFIGCLKRAPPARNGHDKDSPVTTLYKGAYRAAEAIIERDRIAAARGQADSSIDIAPVIPLLDRR